MDQTCVIDHPLISQPCQPTASRAAGREAQAGHQVPRPPQQDTDHFDNSPKNHDFYILQIRCKYDKTVHLCYESYKTT